MAEESKEAPAAQGGAESKPAGTGTPAAKVDEPKPGDQKAPEAQEKEKQELAAKELEAKTAAEAAAKAEADRLAKEEKPAPKAGEVSAEEAEKIKAAEVAAQAEKDMKAGWEKLRKDGGVKLNDEQMLAIETYAKENKLDNAAKAVVIHQQNQILAQQQTAWQDTQKRWVEELQADPEFGGKNFAANMEGAKRFAARYFDPADLKMLDETGLGNAAILVKAFARAHREMMAGDTFVPVGQDPGAKPKKKTAEDALFPNSDANAPAIE